MRKTPKGRRKSDSEFYDERLTFFLEHGSTLKQICPDCVDEYNDHSVLKLISIIYWVAIFNPIVHRQLRKFGIKIAYVDSMAGSGVTSTKRAGDYFCGSCTGAVLHAKNRGFPFDLVLAVEIDKKKAEALEKRLSAIIEPTKVFVHPRDILEISQDIATRLKKKTKSFVVIDPQGFQGMTWSGISPLLRCEGDAMITWFEHDAWRIKTAAESPERNPAAEGQAERLTELIGSTDWMKTESSEELTTLFVNRVLRECGKTYEARVKIPKQDGHYYLMILFTGKFSNAEKLAKDWKKNLERRINSVHGREISSLLDVKTQRISSLDPYLT